MDNLNDYKKAVHARGFNISRMINKFKKDQRERKALYEVPETVLIEVCKEYLVGREVKDNFPYFLKVLTLKTHQFQANKSQEESNKHKNARMPQHIKDIFKSL